MGLNFKSLPAVINHYVLHITCFKKLLFSAFLLVSILIIPSDPGPWKNRDI